MSSGMPGLPLNMGVTIPLDLKEYLVFAGENRKLEIKRERTTSMYTIQTQ